MAQIIYEFQKLSLAQIEDLSKFLTSLQQVELQCAKMYDSFYQSKLDGTIP